MKRNRLMWLGGFLLVIAAGLPAQAQVPPVENQSCVNLNISLLQSAVPPQGEVGFYLMLAAGQPIRVAASLTGNIVNAPEIAQMILNDFELKAHTANLIFAATIIPEDQGVRARLFIDLQINPVQSVNLFNAVPNFVSVVQDPCPPVSSCWDIQIMVNNPQTGTVSLLVGTGTQIVNLQAPVDLQSNSTSICRDLNDAFIEQLGLPCATNCLTNENGQSKLEVSCEKGLCMVASRTSNPQLFALAPTPCRAPIEPTFTPLPERTIPPITPEPTIPLLPFCWNVWINLAQTHEGTISFRLNLQSPAGLTDPPVPTGLVVEASVTTGVLPYDLCQRLRSALELRLSELGIGVLCQSLCTYEQNAAGVRFGMRINCNTWFEIIEPFSTHPQDFWLTPELCADMPTPEPTFTLQPGRTETPVETLPPEIHDCVVIDIQLMNPPVQTQPSDGGQVIGFEAVWGEGLVVNATAQLTGLEDNAAAVCALLRDDFNRKAEQILTPAYIVWEIICDTGNTPGNARLVLRTPAHAIVQVGVTNRGNLVNLSVADCSNPMPDCQMLGVHLVETPQGFIGFCAEFQIISPTEVNAVTKVICVRRQVVQGMTAEQMCGIFSDSFNLYAAALNIPAQAQCLPPAGVAGALPVDLSFVKITSDAPFRVTKLNTDNPQAYWLEPLPCQPVVVETPTPRDTVIGEVTWTPQPTREITPWPTVEPGCWRICVTRNNADPSGALNGGRVGFRIVLANLFPNIPQDLSNMVFAQWFPGDSANMIADRLAERARSFLRIIELPCDVNVEYGESTACLTLYCVALPREPFSSNPDLVSISIGPCGTPSPVPTQRPGDRTFTPHPTWTPRPTWIQTYNPPSTPALENKCVRICLQPVRNSANGISCPVEYGFFVSLDLPAPTPVVRAAGEVDPGTGVVPYRQMIIANAVGNEDACRLCERLREQFMAFYDMMNLGADMPCDVHCEPAPDNQSCCLVIDCMAPITILSAYSSNEHCLMVTLSPCAAPTPTLAPGQPTDTPRPEPSITVIPQTPQSVCKEVHNLVQRVCVYDVPPGQRGFRIYEEALRLLDPPAGLTITVSADDGQTWRPTMDFLLDYATQTVMVENLPVMGCKVCLSFFFGRVSPADLDFNNNVDSGDLFQIVPLWKQFRGNTDGVAEATATPVGSR